MIDTDNDQKENYHDFKNNKNDLSLLRSCLWDVMQPLPRDWLLVWGNRCVTSLCMAELETTTTFITVVSSGKNEA